MSGRGKLIGAVAAIAICALGAWALVRNQGEPYQWVVALVGDDDPRYPFAVLFLALLAPLVALKVVLDRDR